MSLIQDALRRKLDEQTGKSAPPPPPLSPTPLPESSPAQPPVAASPSATGVQLSVRKSDNENAPVSPQNQLVAPPPAVSTTSQGVNSRQFPGGMPIPANAHMVPPPLPAGDEPGLHSRYGLQSPSAQVLPAETPTLSTLPAPQGASPHHRMTMPVLSAMGASPTGANAASPPASSEKPPGRMRALAVVLLLCGIAAAVFYIQQNRNKPGETSAGVSENPEAKSSDDIRIIVHKKPAATHQNPGAQQPSEASTEDKGSHFQTPGYVPLPNIGAVHDQVDKMKEAVADFRKEGGDVVGEPPAKSKPPASVETPSSVKTPPPTVAVAPTPPAAVVTPVQPAAPIVAVAPVPPATTPATPASAAFPVVSLGQPAPAVSAVPVQVWPNVKISGVMAQSTKGVKSAIINDVLVSAGESVDGMSVLEIQDNGVTLDFKGEHRFFPVGRRR